jgi:hypothetical protein
MSGHASMSAKQKAAAVGTGGARSRMSLKQQPSGGVVSSHGTQASIRASGKGNSSATGKTGTYNQKRMQL